MDNACGNARAHGCALCTMYIWIMHVGIARAHGCALRTMYIWIMHVEMHVHMVVHCAICIEIKYKCLYKNLMYAIVQHKLVKMHAELASLNHCAVPFISRADANLCWYYCI